MIARVWRGWTDASRAGEYVEYLNRTGVPGLRGTSGNLAVYVLHRVIADDRTEFVVMSLWDSLESVKAFAGDDVSIARFYPRDDEFLVDRERHCDHYEVPVAPER